MRQRGNSLPKINWSRSMPTLRCCFTESQEGFPTEKVGNYYFQESFKGLIVLGVFYEPVEGILNGSFGGVSRYIRGITRGFRYFLESLLQI